MLPFCFFQGILTGYRQTIDDCRVARTESEMKKSSSLFGGRGGCLFIAAQAHPSFGINPRKASHRTIDNRDKGRTDKEQEYHSAIEWS